MGNTIFIQDKKVCIRSSGQIPTTVKGCRNQEKEDNSYGEKNNRKHLKK